MLLCIYIKTGDITQKFKKIIKNLKYVRLTERKKSKNMV